ncbi:LCP family protein [Phytoactinopolyspora halophila]|nr:LCP family protein [Phytoactinopolyspora halophila]
MPTRDRPPHPTGATAMGRSRGGPAPGAFRRFLGWSIAGVLIPGLGLLAAGRRWIGSAILALFLGGIAAAGIYAYRAGTNGLVRLAADSERMTIVGFALLAIATLWLLNAVVGFHLLQPPGLRISQRLLAVLLVIAVASVVITPIGIGARYASTQRDFIESVFPDERDRHSLTIPDNSTDEDPWAGKDRVDILLLGSDADENRTGVRPDTIMVASVHTETGDTALFSVPRNLQYTPLPEGPLAEAYPDGFRGVPESEYWVSSIYNNLPAQFPDYFEGIEDPGAEAMKLAVGEALGLDIDYYIMVNLDGFEAIVNALGGVEIDVPYRIPIGTQLTSAGTCTPARGWIEEGDQQLLSGGEALWFARARCGPPPVSDDYERMRRQRCLIGAIANQVNPSTLLTRYLQLESATRENFSTDIGRQRLEDFAELGLRVQDAEIRSLPFTDKIVDYYEPDFELMRQFVQESIASLTEPPDEHSPDQNEGTGDVGEETPGDVDGEPNPGSDPGDQREPEQDPGQDAGPGDQPDRGAEPIDEVC